MAVTGSTVYGEPARIEAGGREEICEYDGKV
jgi:hypothetical protein